MSIIEALVSDWTQLLIPVFAGVIGWFTNWVAVQMMFYPTRFVGIRPVGWQGIVPANAVRLANTGLKLVTEQLLDIRDLFKGFHGTEFAGERKPEMEALVRRLIAEKAAHHFPAMWKNLPDPVKEQVYKLALEEVMKMSAEVLDEARDRIGELLDVSAIVTRAVTEDRELMTRIFKRVGSKEFKFIEISGWWFGLLFGLPQLAIWLIYPAWWVLPVFGFLVGYATNWLALWLIFDPKQPKRVGPWTFHGLFHRRQQDIALEFSDVMSTSVLSSDNIFREVTGSSARKELLDMVKRRGDAIVEKYQKNPMTQPLFAMGAAADIQTDVLREVEGEMFREGGLIYAFTDKADQIRQELRERMKVMDAESFENVLRPAFKQDEWKLILAGAVLGLVAGWAQVATLFYDRLL